jgi:uncharacterized membrane protein
MARVVCEVCKKKFKLDQLFLMDLLRPSIKELLQSQVEGINFSGYICSADLSKFRAMHMQQLLQREKGELSSHELEVLENIKQQEILSENVNKEFANQMSFGDKIADKIASFGGSWSFIFTFAMIIIVWMGVNVSQLLQEPFDPFPFILLNLVLSSLAAFQAPVIMMSQKRQALKDKVRSDHEYLINLKAELQIRMLQSKLDRFMNQEWNRLLEIQEVQLELSDEILRKKKDKPST